MRQISHNFHNKMPLQLPYIATILDLAQHHIVGTKEEISIKSGIPTGEGSGKVLSHIEFAKSMGLIDYIKEKGKFSLFPTKLGNYIYEQDPYLLENVTKMMCNYWLTDKEIGIPQWYYFMREGSTILNTGIDTSLLEKRIQQNFETPLYMSVVYSTYGPDCFQDLDVIEYNKVQKKVTFKEGSCNITYKYVYAYTLLKSWEVQFQDYREITIDQIIEELKWNKPFGFSYDEILSVLEELAIDNIVSLNKQLTPITIIKIKEADELLSHLYDLTF